MIYAKLENGNVVVDLPMTGILQNGSTVSCYNLLSYETLLAEGWLPYEDQIPEYTSETQVLSSPEYTIEQNKIIANYTIIYKDINEAKQNKINELNSICNQTILLTFNSFALGISHVYKFDEEAQFNFTHTEQALKYYPEDAIINWRTVDSGVLTHSKQQFIQLFLDSLSHKLYNINKYRELEQLVNNAITIEEINNINWVNENE